MEPVSNTVYDNLKTVVMSALVSVVSFQLLGPAIWGYMHKLTGMGYKTAYSYFIIGYVLGVPMLVLGWLTRDFNLIKKYLRPTDSPAMDLASAVFLIGIICILLIQLIIGWYFLLNDQLSWKSGFYTWPAYFFMAGCLALLAGGAILSCLRLSDARNYKQQVITLIPSSVSGTAEDLKAEYRYKKRTVLQQLIFILLLFVMAMVFWGYYSSQKRAGLFRHPETVAIGFPLEDLRDTVEAVRGKEFELVNDLQLLNQRDSALLMASGQPVLADSALTKLQVDTSLEQRQFSQSDALLELIQRIIVCQHKNTPAPGEIRAIQAAIQDQILHYKELSEAYKHSRQLWAEKGFFLTPHSSPTRKAILYQDSVVSRIRTQMYADYSYLTSTGRKLDDLIRKQLGNLLRDDQFTGMFILFILFLTLLSLYIFLRTTATSIAWELESDRLITRIQEYIHPNEQKKLDNEMQSVRLEKQLAETSSLSGIAWIFVTLVVWLLIPFFKPIEDARIDLSSPYKSLTFSNETPATIWGPTHEIRDTVIAPNVHIDSVVIHSGPGSQPGDVNRELLQAIIKKVDSIERHIQPPVTK